MIKKKKEKKTSNVKDSFSIEAIQKKIFAKLVYLCILNEHGYYRLSCVKVLSIKK